MTSSKVLIQFAFITGNSSLEPLLEGLFAQIHLNLSWRVFGRNRTGDLRITKFVESRALHQRAKVTDESPKIPHDPLRSNAQGIDRPSICKRWTLRHFLTERYGNWISWYMYVSPSWCRHFQYLGLLTGAPTTNFARKRVKTRYLTLFCATKNCVVICRARLLYEMGYPFRSALFVPMEF